MTIHLNDERDYSTIVEDWIREFMWTMDEGRLHPGDNSGDVPAGVKIIFDGYGYDEETNEENADETMMSFAVFVHKNSLTEEFPEHELTPWALIHRPNEEVCIYAWYDSKNDQVDIIPFEDNNGTNLDHKFVNDLIFKIAERDGWDFETDNSKTPTTTHWPFPTKDKND